MGNILITTQYTQLPGEKGNNRGRFKYIAELLSDEGHNVTVVTSKFRELDRAFRDKDDPFYQNAPYKIVLLEDRGYQKSISLNRISSMISFSNSLKQYLDDKDGQFDLVYTCVPGLRSSVVAGEYAERNTIPFIIDVQDAWPEVMKKLILDTAVISNILFYPLQKMADKVYGLADGIMAVSETYMKIATEKNTKSKKNDYVYIGSFIDPKNSEYDEIPTIKKDNEYWIAYIGSISHSYDLKTFILGVEKANKKGINVRAIIIGSGPLGNELKNFAIDHGDYTLFTGWLDIEMMRTYLDSSDLVINAIIKKSPASITNKVGDYLSAGKPMLNGSQNYEIKKMLSDYNFGINYNPEDSDSLAEAIINIFSLNQEERKNMGDNARKVAENYFDRKKTYKKIIKMIEYFL